ncbi:aldo/keto reductase [Legionella sp.]|uniref:aldo/keto reductase n=1 Tax=Legionella sp. TaxID=459 RepID=UPI000CA756DF|nr:aldo/keto reductase [Legionella sp.]PJE16602.1 MAG: alcohol dehydrogenase [Legionella sp.]
MEYLQLGQSDLKVSKLCLGCMSYGDPTSGHYSWVLNEKDSRPFIKQALDLGINFFDTANMYSFGASERILGKALKDFTQRSEVVIATKIFFPMIKEDPSSGGLSRKSILYEVDQSLKRLGTDYIDLYQIHRWDYKTPIEETLEALDEVVKAGKARYIGASSMFAWQFAKSLYLADQHHWQRFISMQPHYNLIYREEEREMFPLCQEEKIAILPWSPLARGRLARSLESQATIRSQTDQVGKKLYDHSREADNQVIKQVNRIAQQREITPSQVALAWLFNNPAISTPIIGATIPHHLEDAVQALGIKLTKEEIRSLEAPYVPHEIAGFSRD